MARHPRTAQFETRLKELFDEVDDYLEEKYGSRYRLHPARAERGEIRNKEHSGLFNVGASFSPGYGSEHGRGYVIQMDMVTLVDVDEETERAILEETAEQVEARLPRFFPERELGVSRDGRSFKIHGDLSLGTA